MGGVGRGEVGGEGEWSTLKFPKELMRSILIKITMIQMDLNL